MKRNKALKESKVLNIPFDRVVADPRFDVREGDYDKDAIADYASREADTAPPLIVTHDNRLLSGWHRHKAAHQRGDSKVKVIRLSKADDDTYYHYAVKANADHGVQYTRAQKRRLAERLFAIGDSNSDLAKMLGVGERTVQHWTQKLRAEKIARRDSEILRLKAEGMVQARIAEEVGTDESTVSKVIKLDREAAEAEAANAKLEEALDAHKAKRAALETQSLQPTQEWDDDELNEAIDRGLAELPAPAPKPFVNTTYEDAVEAGVIAPPAPKLNAEAVSKLAPVIHDDMTLDEYEALDEVDDDAITRWDIWDSLENEACLIDAGSGEEVHEELVSSQDYPRGIGGCVVLEYRGTDIVGVIDAEVWLAESTIS